MMRVLEICRYANPFSFARLKPSYTLFKVAVESLNFFPASMVNSICEGYPEYVRLSSELPFLSPDSTVAGEMDAVKVFWKTTRQSLGRLNPFVRYCFTIQCSSGSVERVFSVLTNTFGPQQDSTYEDYMCLSLMRQFNKRDDQ
jgi:hypothetical protein